MSAASASAQLGGIDAGEVRAQCLTVRGRADGPGTAVQVLDAQGNTQAMVGSDGQLRGHALVVDRVVLTGEAGRQLELRLDAAGRLLFQAPVPAGTAGPPAVLAMLSLT